MTCGIYSFANSLSGKSYIGSSNNIERRKNDHLRWLSRGTHPNPHLQSAYFQDRDDFYFTVLKVCEQDELLEWEQFYVDLYGPEKLYNIALDVERPLIGLEVSALTRRRMSESRKGRVITDETRQKISKASKGRQKSDKERQKLSKALKGRVSPTKGRPKSEEQKQKMSEVAKGRKHSEKTKQKLRDANKGKSLPAETRQKISETLKGRPAHNKGTSHTAETRRKMSESRRLYEQKRQPAT